MDSMDETDLKRQRGKHRKQRRAGRNTITNNGLIQCMEFLEVETLTKEKMKEYREAFSLFDKNGDGHITTKELTSVLKSLGQELSEEEIKHMIEEADQDGSGTVEFQEFLEVMARSHKESDDPADEVLAAFRVFDPTNTGKIKSEKLRHIMENMGDQMSEREVDEMIRDAGVDENGLVNYSDFVQLLFQGISTTKT